jgi:carbon monoxide dehydrogenase subunit G
MKAAKNLDNFDAMWDHLPGKQSVSENTLELTIQISVHVSVMMEAFFDYVQVLREVASSKLLYKIATSNLVLSSFGVK